MCAQLAREKLKTQEDSLRLAVQKGRLHRSLGTAEQELAEAQKHIQVLRVGAPGQGPWPRTEPSAGGCALGAGSGTPGCCLPARCSLVLHGDGAGLLLGFASARGDAGACTGLVLGSFGGLSQLAETLVLALGWC